MGPDRAKDYSLAVHKGKKANERELLDVALANPSQALAECDTYLNGEIDDPDKQVACLRARGLAYRLLGNLDASAHDLETGLELAEKLGDKQLRAGVALTLAGTRVFQGRIDDAKTILLDCIEAASGEVRAEAIFQLGSTHGQAGELEQCLKYYSQALPLLRRYGRRDWESNLLGNRGIANFLAGDFTASIRDLDQAIEIQHELGIPAQAAINTLNKAQAMYMMGDLAGSLDLYRAAENVQDELGMPVLMHAQKIETLLAAGMFEDCLDLSQRTHQFHHQSEMTIGKIRALLPGAEAALALGQNVLARRLAQEISRTDGAENFKPWLDRAELTRLEAKVLDRAIGKDDHQTALSIYIGASKTHTATALRGLLLASNIYLVRDEVDEAIGLLEQSVRLARRSPLHLQIQRWQLVARARSQAQDRRGTLSAVRSGLHAYDRLLAGVTSYDTRARSSRHAEGLAEIGIRELFARRRFGDTAQLIARLRSASIRRSTLSAAQTQELIVADTKLRTGQVGVSAADLLTLQKRSVPTVTSTPPGAARPSKDESLLTWVDVDGAVYCLHGTAHRTEAHACGTSAEIEALVEDHQFVHRQLSRRRRLSPLAVSSLLDRKVHADAALDALLFPPRLQSRVVLNPTSQLTSVVWGSLPALARKPHVVAPSLALTRLSCPRSPSLAAVLGSSALEHVPAELDAISAIYNASPQLDPSIAARSAIDGVDVVHIAGHFVSDGSNPLFSGIPLGDERLRGVDYLQLERPPKLAVLSACASAETEAIGGAGIGFVTAALTAGTRSVIATQTLVGDDTDTVATMERLHELLAAGHAPAEALVNLRANADDDSSMPWNLVVYGVGW